jgi:hypothetical protein
LCREENGVGILEALILLFRLFKAAVAAQLKLRWGLEPPSDATSATGSDRLAMHSDEAFVEEQDVFEPDRIEL